MTLFIVFTGTQSCYARWDDGEAQQLTPSPLAPEAQRRPNG